MSSLWPSFLTCHSGELKKLTVWFCHSEKPHQRAVHLGPSAGWCQDWQWPRSRRTESSSERSAVRCFPFLCLCDIFLPRGTSGTHFRGPGPEHWGLSTANSNYSDRSGGGEGSSDPQQAPLTAFKFTLRAASVSRGSRPLSCRGLGLQSNWSDARQELGLSCCVWAAIRLLDRSLEWLFQTGKSPQRLGCSLTPQQLWNIFQFKSCGGWGKGLHKEI